MAAHRTRRLLASCTLPAVLVALAAVLGIALGQNGLRAEEVSFENGDLTLTGTLTLPETSPPYAAIVTISGSGPQNRDGEIPGIDGYAPFADLAAHLGELGVAVLRYDDRGVGASEGDHATATSADFATDVEAAVAYLQGRPDIDRDQIGLLGHSEGGMVAPMVAARNEAVAFVIAMAPPVAEPLEGLVRQEERMLAAAGMPPDAAEIQVEQTRRALELTRAGDFAALEELIRGMVETQLAALPEEQRAQFGDTETAVEMLVAQTMTQYRGWMHWFLNHDPQADWAAVRVPALAVFAELDVQVDLEQHLTALESVGNPQVDIAVIPEANHLFQRTTSGSVTEYGTLAPELTPALYESLTTWIEGRIE